MKRLFIAAICCMVLLGIAPISASAESSATRVDSYCTVNSDGDVLVSMTVTLRLESTVNTLSFPLPLEATNISVGGSSANISKTTSATSVDVSRYVQGIVGEISLRFDYTLPEAVKVVVPEEPEDAEPYLQLVIPLLCGFEFPVENLSFVITMPSGEMPNAPEFTSIYRQGSIGSDLSVTVDNNQIIGFTTTGLNDHDGITMTMVVAQSMFPTVSTYIREGNPEVVPMLICAGVALLYWLIFLRCRPILRKRNVTPPEGITAGELGCRLTLSGGDLTAMVFSWGQLGYLIIHLDESGRVMLHKRMDMGNERSQFENKVFQQLFANRKVVDATGYPYAKLCRKVAGIVPSERNMYKGNSGNMKIFRGIACGTQVFCGVCVAMNMSTVFPLQILLSIILGVFGAVSAWLIQDVAYRTHLRGKVPVYIGLVCMLIWILLGFLCGEILVPLCSVLGEMLLGYFAAYGGRRSELGLHDASQILGLRYYIKHIPRDQISSILSSDPDYFFNMAPYALALGVINPFSKAFGRRKLDQCPYLFAGVHGKRTAEDWGRIIADTADKMDAKSRKMMIEKFTAVQLRLK